TGPHQRALLAIRLPRPRRLRQQGAVGDALPVRRPQGETELKLEVVGDAEAAAERGAELIVEAARDAVEDHGTFALAVSGGRTPWRMLALLSDMPLAWEETQ